MPTAPTHAIARVIGPLMFVFGLAMALHRIDADALVQAFFADPALIFFGGFVSLLLGLIIVSTHNVWSTPTPILISLFGWILCIRGAVLLFAPEAIRDIGLSFAANTVAPLIGGLVAAVLGAWFTYVGFFTSETSK
jgi:hypothetical protein